MDEQLRVFVIMPFESEFDSIYAELIRKPLESAGCKVSRADSLLGGRNILQKIVEGILGANLVIADLTTLNPNVFYELGLCHGRDIPVFLITQFLSEVPFDLKSYEIFEYSTHFEKTPQLESILKGTVEKLAKGKITFSNPIKDFSPLTGKECVVKLQETVKVEDGAEKKGFLDFLLEGEQAAEESNKLMSEITQETKSIGDKMAAYAENIGMLAKDPTPGMTIKLNSVTLLAAGDMVKYAEKVRNYLIPLENNNDIFRESYGGYIGWVRPKNKEDKEQLLKLHKEVSGLLEATKTAIESMYSYRGSLTTLRDVNVSRAFNQATNQVISVVQTLISSFEKTEAFCEKSLIMINAKLRE